MVRPMLRRSLIAAAALVPLTLGGCAATIRPMHAPSEAIRYHLSGQIVPGTISIESTSSAPQISQEYQTFSNAVGAQLTQNGFTVTTDSDKSEYVAGFTFTRTGKGVVQKRPPLSIGIGAGGYTGGYRGGGVGLGGSVSTPVGRSATAEVVETRLNVMIRRRSDNTTIWEGHARTQGISGTGENRADVVAPKLAAAMFKGFPGESGITISVK